jgi:hypothetical protein
MVQKKGFNLLKTQVEPQTMWTKLYRWTTTTARAIMVFVELIIVVAFGFRVVVDLQFKNLNKDIASKEEIMSVLQESEMRLRSTQDRIGLYEQLWKDTPYYSNVYLEITKIVPVNVQELSVQILNNEVTIKGFADAQAIEDIESGFKNSNLFTKTELLNIESQGTDTDSFTIKSNLNNLPMRSEVLF